MTDRVKNMEKEYEKKILRTTFGIGRQRRLNNPQLASRYSDAVLENWVPKQELMPVDIHGKRVREEDSPHYIRNRQTKKTE